MAHPLHHLRRLSRVAVGTCLAATVGVAGCVSPPSLMAIPSADRIDAEVRAAMAQSGALGLAVAVIDDGRVAHVRSFGQRDAAGRPLETNTVMYGASLTKALFAAMSMQLVDEGRLSLDGSIADLLPQPLPAYPNERGYGPWRDLAGDERWRQLTPRILLSHRAGFANFAFLEPDGKLRLHFEPGSRYAYSGEGLILLQFVLERGLALDVGQAMQSRVFERFGMGRTSMTWREDFAANAADGFDAAGTQRPHARNRRVRAAGSMDTTIDDFAVFAAGFMRGEGISAASRREMLRAQAPITTASQFPTLQPELPVERRRPSLGAGLGVITFTGAQGPGFFKGGHDDFTANTWVCIERGRRCVVLLSNDVRAEAVFPRLVTFILGDAGVPWTWEYAGE